MAKVRNLAGCYQIKGHSKLVKQTDDGQSLELIISERQHPTVKKPKQFIVCRMPDNSRVYVSSIYVSDTGVKHIEHAGSHYSFTMQGDKVYIQHTTV